MTRSRVSPARRPILLLVLVLFGCADAPSALGPDGALHSRAGGKGGGGSTGTPAVSAVDPASGRQGETRKLVRIAGSGFDGTSRAAWERNGKPDPKVVVHATRFLSATELEAEISVADDAVLAQYDVTVTLSSGKKGIGMEMFEVIVGDPTAAVYLPTGQDGLGLLGDGHFSTGNPVAGTSRYRERECGVHSKIFATTALSNSGDAIMDPAMSGYQDRKCAAYPRRIRIDLSNPDVTTAAQRGVVETLSVRINVLGLQNSHTGIPIGTTEERPLNLALTGSKYCDAIRFRPTLPAYGNVETGADMVRVTRLGPGSWRVWTAAGAAKAACLRNGVVVGRYHIPVDFHLIADRNLLP